MEDFVSTRASHIKRNYVSVNYEVLKKKLISTDNFVNKQKLQKNSPIDSVTKKNLAELKREQEKEMKRARYDVIKLGAVPPRNRRMNYKKLKVRRKIDDEEIKKKQHISGLTSSLLKLKFKKGCKKDSSILEVYGKVPKSALSKQKNRACQ